MIHTISTLPRDSQDDKILPEHNKFISNYNFAHTIQVID